MSVNYVEDRTSPGRGCTLLQHGSNINRSSPPPRSQDTHFDLQASIISSQSKIAYCANDVSNLQTHRVSVDQDLSTAQKPKTPPAIKAKSSKLRIEILAQENANLRQTISALENANASAHDTINKISSDLISTQSALAQKESAMEELQAVISSQKAELERLQEDKNMTIPQDGDKSADQEEIIKNLKTEMQRKDSLLGERENDLEELGADLAREKQRGGNALAELQVLKIELKELRRSRDNAQRLLFQTESAQAQMEAEQELHQAALDAAKAQTEQHLQELQQLQALHEGTLFELDTEKTKVQHHRLELEVLKAKASKETEDNSQALSQLKATHAAELAELRRSSGFFKRNSERLSKETRDLWRRTRP